MENAVPKHEQKEILGSTQSIRSPTTENCAPQIYSADTVAKYGATLIQVACAITVSYNKGSVIEKYTRRFEKKAHLEPLRLCGNDEYLHPTDVVELLCIAALCESMASFLESRDKEMDSDGSWVISRAGSGRWSLAIYHIRNPR